MKVQDLRKKSIDELNSELVSLLKEQFNSRMQRNADNSDKSTHIFRQTRRNIARVKTLIAESAAAGK